MTNKKQFRVAIAIIRNKEDKYLLIKSSRDYGQYSNCWYPPGGHLEKNETVKECLKRELKEELALEIIPVKEIAVTSGDVPNQITHWWGCKLISGKLQIDKSLQEAGFFSNKEIVKMDLWPATRKFFEDYIWKE